MMNLATLTEAELNATAGDGIFDTIIGGLAVVAGGCGLVAAFTLTAPVWCVVAAVAGFATLAGGAIGVGYGIHEIRRHVY